VSAARLRLASIDGVAIGKPVRWRKPPPGSYAAAAIEAREAARACFTPGEPGAFSDEAHERVKRLEARLLDYPIVTIEDAIAAMDIAGKYAGDGSTRQAIAGVKLVLRNLARRRRR